MTAATDPGGEGRGAAAYWIERFYGNAQAYEIFKREHGITPDHAAMFERYGVILQPLQWDFSLWARRCDDDDGPNEIGLGGARGPGKSFTVFAQVALDDCQRWPGIKALYLRKTGKAASEQLDDLVSAVLAQFQDYEFKAGTVRFANGSRIVFGGFKDDNEALKYQGLEYDIFVPEETTQLREKTYKTLRLSIRSTKIIDGRPFRARTYNTTNPLGVGHQFYKRRFVDNEKAGRPDTRKKFIFGTVEDNKALSQDYIDTLDDLSGAEYRAYRLGDWSVSAGAYFEEWDDDLLVIPDLAQIGPEWDAALSMDYGFNHWNVIHLHARDGDGVFYTIDELCHRKHHPDEIAPQVMDMLARWKLVARFRNEQTIPAYAGADIFRQTGVARRTIAEQYAAKGIHWQSADTAPGTRVQGAHELAKLLGVKDRDIPPRWYVAKRCTRLIETMPYLEHDPNSSEDVMKVDADEHGAGGDDAYDSARYGLMAMLRYRKLTVKYTSF